MGADSADAIDVGPLFGSGCDQVLDAAEPVEQRSGGTDRDAGHGREKAESWVGKRRHLIGTDGWGWSLKLGLAACVSEGEAVDPEGGVVGVSALEEGDPGVCDCEEGAADRVWVSRAGVEVGAFNEQAWVRSGVAQSSELCPESVAAE